MIGLVVPLIGCAAPRPQQPNVVLITLDTFRADLLSAYGAEKDLTPELNRLAREAVVFENAVTPIGTTFPAHASLFTGLYPRQHGVRWNGDRLGAEYQTLAERMREAGYRTAAFVSLPSMLRRGGLGQGFDHQIVQSRDKARHVLEAAEVNAAALDWLSKSGPEPFFLWLHYFETHSPYRLTRHARQVFARRGYQGPLADGASTELFYALGDTVALTPNERDAVRALYEGEAVELDRALEDLFSHLRRLNVLDQSLVVVTADHGQALGEHEVVGHGFLLWQPVVSVPLLFRTPAPTRGRRIKERVGIIDLQATILDQLGLPAVSDSGRSLVPALKGDRLTARPYFIETRVTADSVPESRDVAAAGLAVLFDRHKGIRWTEDWLWVNLRDDPLEHGASSVPAEQRIWLQQQLEEFVAVPAADPGQDRLDPQHEGELRALGYLQ